MICTLFKKLRQQVTRLKILTCCQASKSKNVSYTKGKQIYDLAKLFKIWSDNILDYMNNISPANNKCGRWNGIVDGFTEKKS